MSEDARDPALGVYQRVRIYHNVATDDDGRRINFDGYEPGQPVTLVAEFTLAGEQSVHHLLDLVYEQTNVDIPTWGFATHYRHRRNRSLSIGDLVEVNGEVFACSSEGWEPVEGPLNRVTVQPGRGTNPL